MPKPRTSSEAVRQLSLQLREASDRRADLYPALGLPTEAGPCLVVDRIRNNVKDPKLQERLIKELENGDFDGQEERILYDPLKVRGPGNTTMELTEHAQFREDLRGVTIADLRISLQNFYKWLNDGKSTRNPIALGTEEDLMWGRRIVWEDKKLGLKTVFQRDAKKNHVIISTYWTNVPDPKMPPGGCQ